jgi:hypothetical protein
MIDLFTDNHDDQSTHSFIEDKSQKSNIPIEEEKEYLLFDKEENEMISENFDNITRIWNEPNNFLSNENDNIFDFNKEKLSQCDQSNFSTTFASNSDESKIPSPDPFKHQNELKFNDKLKGGESADYSEKTVNKYLKKSPFTNRSFGGVEISEGNIQQLKREYYSNFDYKAYIEDYLKNIGKLF